MTETVIVCPNCNTSIELTERLAGPLIEEARRQFQQRLTEKEADFGRREQQLKAAEGNLAKARAAIDAEVAGKLKTARATIVEAEAEKARLAVADDIGRRDRQMAELQEILTANNAKLA
jgi:hypothetical protein